MGKYEQVLIDADETLFDFRKAETWALDRACARFGVAATQTLAASYDEINRSLWRALERGETDQETLKTERFRILFRGAGLDIDPTDFGLAFIEGLSSAAFLLPGAEEICAYLGGKYALVLVTNGIREVQRSRLERSSLRDSFDAVAISEEAGSSKPDPGIFEYACGLTGKRDKDRMIMIGDSLGSDILGGIRFGIDTCWFNRAAVRNETEILPVYEVESLEELRTIL